MMGMTLGQALSRELSDRQSRPEFSGQRRQMGFGKTPLWGAPA